MQEKEKTITATGSSIGVSEADIVTVETEHVAMPVIPTTITLEHVVKEVDGDSNTVGGNEEGWSTPTRFIRSPRKGIISHFENIPLLQETRFDCLQDK